MMSAKANCFMFPGLSSWDVSSHLEADCQVVRSPCCIPKKGHKCTLVYILHVADCSLVIADKATSLNAKYPLSLSFCLYLSYLDCFYPSYLTTSCSLAPSLSVSLSRMHVKKKIKTKSEMKAR